MDTRTRKKIEQVYKRFAGKALASPIRILGDFDRAEEAQQETFVHTLESWPLAKISVNIYPKTQTYTRVKSFAL